MASIPAPPPPPPPPCTVVSGTASPPSDARTALLSDITKGVQLKKCIPNERPKNVEFLDGNNVNDPSVSGFKSNEGVKCNPLASALHAELTNTLKKRKTSKAAVDTETLKDGIRTFDPNILNTHVPQPTGLKITHASPNFSVNKKIIPTSVEKKEEHPTIKNETKPPIMPKLENRTETPKESSVPSVIPKKVVNSTVTTTTNPVKFLSNGVDTVDNKSSVQNVEKKIQKLKIDDIKAQLNNPVLVKSETKDVENDNQGVTSPSVKALKKQLSVASQTDLVEKNNKKIQIQENVANHVTVSPSKTSPTRPTILKVNSVDGNGTAKKIRHPVPNFTVSKKPTKTIGSLKSPVKTPTSPKIKSFQKENITFNRPTIASLQRQHSNNNNNKSIIPDKKSINTIKTNRVIHHSIDNSYEIPTNFDKKTQISFSKELSNAKNNFQETVKTTKRSVVKTDLVYNNVNFANVKMEIDPTTENVIKIVPKY